MVRFLALIATTCLLAGCVRAFTAGAGGAATDATADATAVDAAAVDTAAGDLQLDADAITPPPVTNEVFFSVGQNTADHKTGEPTVTIAAGLATFSVAQTAANMGVGDVVKYGSDRRCFIAAKVTTRKWRCTTGTGATPAPVTGAFVHAISHAFRALGTAVDAAHGSVYLGTKDLIAAGRSVSFPCYCDEGGADTVRAIVSGWETGPQNRIRIYTPVDTATECNQRQRHAGTWNDDRYRLEVTNLGFSEAGLTVKEPYTVVDGLQVLASGPSNVDGMQTTGGPAGRYYFSNNIVAAELNSASQNSDGICSHGGTSNQQLFAWNNIIYGFDQGSEQAAAFYISSASNTLVAYNNTIVGCDYGVYRKGGAAVVKNNLVQAQVGSFWGAFSAASDYNVSSDGKAPGAHSKTNTTALFVDAAKGDYHLRSTDTAAHNAGVDLSKDATWPLKRDIDGDLRAAPWDVGADEAP